MGDLDIYGRTTVAAMAGGIAASAGGGKFANGAVTAAMVHLFNAEYVDKDEDYRAFKIIEREWDDWINSSETEDLRNGLGISIDFLGVRIKFFAILDKGLDIDTLWQDWVNGDYAQFWVDAAAIVAGESAKNFLSKGFSLKNDLPGVFGSTFENIVVPEVVQPDCFAFFENKQNQ